jgi:hypothetical protein
MYGHGHADKDFARPAERIARMRNQHVIQEQDIACFPSKFNLRPPIRVPEGFRRIFWNGAAVPEIGLIGKSLFSVVRNQSGSHIGGQSRVMEERRMIEPEVFGSIGMPADGGSAPPRSQTALHPFELISAPSAELLYRLAVFRLKCSSPR